MAVYAPSTVLAWNIAAIEAKSGHATEIEPAHLLLGICKLCDLDIDRFCPKQIRDSRSQRQEFQKDVQILQQWFENWGLDPTVFRRRLRTRMVRTDRNIIHEGIMHRDALSRDVFERAEEISALHAIDEAIVRPCHVLQSLFEQPDTPWDSLLADMGIYQFDRHQADAVDWESLEMLPEEAEAAVMPVDEEPFFRNAEKSNTPLLDSFGRDLTQLARDGQLDPTIGRDREIRSLASILMQRRKRNAILVGEAGVGKTCIIEGLTQWLMTEAAPQVLRQQRVVEISMASLLAGSKYRGEFEERIQGIVAEASNNPNTIIFIDEIHTMLGAGGAGASDAANILKPALARGELHCIGATTVREYRQTIEKDGALERRFQTVWVYEPNPEETRQILRGLRPRFEQHHQLTISDAAIDVAVSLCGRYITDACFPDKAIDAIDRACANARLQMETPSNPLPTSAQPLDPSLDHPSSKPPEPPKSSEPIKGLQSLNLFRGFKLAKGVTSPSLSTFNPGVQTSSVPRSVPTLVNSLEDSVTEGLDFGDPTPAAGSTTIPTTQTTPLILTELDVIQAIAQRCRLPIERLSEDERSRLLRMESFLRQQVIGQDRAIEVVADAIRTARSGLKVPQRPVGVFLFVGKTGTGKTRLAQALAEFLFDDRRRLVRIDMSEYMEPNSVSRLLGAPPGYIGHETEGQLSGAVRTNPYSVVLFDEVEKAHPQVLDLLLQVLDEGRLTDAQGREVLFNETTIVLTSNLGANLAGHRGLGFECEGDDRERQDLYEAEINRALSQHLRPELLNRIGEVVYFYPLSPTIVREIVDKLLDEIRVRLSDRQINIVMSSAAYDLLVKRGYNPEMGAREMERTVERLLVRPIGQGLLTRRFSNHSTISIDVLNHELTFDTPAISSPPKLEKQASLETEV
jgi:ATP-dependent Clp protease ATP-binding subunit ClpC